VDSFLKSITAEACKRKPELTGSRSGKHPPVNVLEVIRREFFFIAEIKHRSPSVGTVREDFDHRALAGAYSSAGASAISVITEEDHFGGAPRFLKEVREVTDLPLLRKDFIVTMEQVRESYILGADIVLLIAACLTIDMLRSLQAAVLDLGMTPLVEIHTEGELDMVLKTDPVLLGVNNRNLNDFRVSLETSLKLAELIPRGIPRISESGISSREHIAIVREAGFHGVLVGESLLRQQDPGKALRSLRNG